MTRTFRAPEYHADGSIAFRDYRIEGSERSGLVVHRDGLEPLRLGHGYRELDVIACGVCATDLARRYLPFPLPQTTGHEVLARDREGRRHVVEISASHAARGLDASCPACDTNLATHCPERLVLGIDRLPGGFGPVIAAPHAGTLPVDDAIPDETAVLVEPFAAALHAVQRVDLRGDDEVLVLGPRRLGMLVLAALAGERRRLKTGWRLRALVRREALVDLARTLGADDVHVLGEDVPAADVVIDTTGSPEGLETAVALARREVHLKSTHGQVAAGVEHLTEMVVDEITLGPYREGVTSLPPCPGRRPVVAWTAAAPPPRRLTELAHVVVGDDPRGLLERLAHDPEAAPRGRADVAVVDGARAVGRALRPDDGREISLVRPRGSILVPVDVRDSAPLVEAVTVRGVRLTTSRCGDFAAALERMRADPDLRRLGERLVTHRVARDDLAEAFALAASPEAVKVVVGGS